MTREQVKSIFTDATEEQLVKLLDISTTDIGKAKNDYEKIKSELATANGSLKSYEGTISELKKSLSEDESFKTKFETLEKHVKEEKEKAEKAAKEAAEEFECKTRFSAVAGERKWRDELTSDAVFELFKKAVKDEGNKGKGDKDILEDLTKDKSYYENPNAPADMQGMGNVAVGNVGDSQMRAIMGLVPSKE